MNYLLDTNICIYVIKRKPPEVIRRFLTLSTGEMGVSTITVAELRHGAERSSDPIKNQRALEQFLSSLDVVDFDYLAAGIYGQIHHMLEKCGLPIGPLDTLIAAHAIRLDATLVTNNLREFGRVPGLNVENWVGE